MFVIEGKVIDLKGFMLVFLAAVMICSPACRAARTTATPPRSAPSVITSAHFDPLTVSTHLQEADQALRALSEDVSPGRRAALHARFAATLHLLELSRLSGSYLEQVRQRDPMLAPLLEPLEAELDASMPSTRERYLAATTRDARRLLLARQFEHVKHIDPVVGSLLDVSLPFDQLARETSPVEALFLLERDTRKALLEADYLARQNESARARALLERVDEEIFSHQVLGMNPWLRSKWVEVGARLGAQTLIATSLRRELPLYFDEQTPARERAPGLLLGCELLAQAGLYEDAMRYCEAGRALVKKSRPHGSGGGLRYAGEHEESDKLAEVGFDVAMALGEFEEAEAFLSLHENAAWRATSLSESFEQRVFSLLRARGGEHQEARLAEARELARFAHNRLGPEEELIAALLVFAHAMPGEGPRSRAIVEELLSSAEVADALFSLAPGATLSLQLRAQALLIAVADEVGFEHERLTIEEMERAHELQREELPEQEDYRHLIVELARLDVTRGERGSDFESAAKISPRSLCMVDVIALTDANRGLEADVVALGRRVQRAPTLLFAWLERLKRAGYVVALLKQFEREEIEVLASLPPERIGALRALLSDLEVEDERARIELAELLLGQLGHEPEVRREVEAMMWRAWSVRDLPPERVLSLYEKWVEIQMVEGVSVAQLMARTSEEVTDQKTRRLASSRLLRELFDREWLSPEIDGELLTRLERQVASGSRGRYALERARIAALRARIGDCEQVAMLDAELFEAFPPALPVVVRGCRDEVGSGALHAWLMTRAGEEARALRELLFELLYGVGRARHSSSSSQSSQTGGRTCTAGTVGASFREKPCALEEEEEEDVIVMVEGISRGR